MERQLKLLSTLAAIATLMIGCGPGFRAAKFESKTFVTTVDKADKVDDNRPAEDSRRLEDQVPKSDYEEEKAEVPAVQKQIVETNPKEKAETENKEEPVKNDALIVNIGGLTLEGIKENLSKLNPEVASYLQGLTITIRGGDDKKMSVEVLAVIQRSAEKIERIFSEGEVTVVDKKVALLTTSIVKYSSQAAMYSSSADLYTPSKSTELVMVCEEGCNTAYLKMRSLKKEKEVLELILELKRHGRNYEIVKSNASDKPLMIKSYHEAE